MASQNELLEAYKKFVPAKMSFRSIDTLPPTPVCSLMASLIELHLADQLIRPE